MGAERPKKGPDLRVINLGAGVQSTTMALMAASGAVAPMPDVAIFADTQWEPRHVYRHLDWLEAQLPFPVHRVSAGNLRAHIVSGTKGCRLANPPFFTSGGGMLRRQCTRDFKINPIQKEIRRILGAAPGARLAGRVMVEQWIGISLDEIQRMKVSREKWTEFRHPLIERRMTRLDCLQWLKRNGYPEPKKSACLGCPYHSNAEWRAVRDVPEEWADVVELDRLIRNGVRGTEEQLFLHRDRVPIDSADIASAEEKGQISWLDECEGMCGV